MLEFEADDTLLVPELLGVPPVVPVSDGVVLMEPLREVVADVGTPVVPTLCVLLEEDREPPDCEEMPEAGLEVETLPVEPCKLGVTEAVVGILSIDVDVEVIDDEVTTEV